jgi:hypothetical protein
MSKHDKDYGTKMYEAVTRQKMSDEARASFERNREKIIRQYNTLNLAVQQQGNLKRADYANTLNLSLYNGGYN